MVAHASMTAAESAVYELGCSPLGLWFDYDGAGMTLRPKADSGVTGFVCASVAGFVSVSLDGTADKTASDVDAPSLHMRALPSQWPMTADIIERFVLGAQR